ncbi:MAG: hypothetical protein M3450_00520, partial [Actinomycetota bacterium]|nr:hypothetical protein [Actinomycetota bacterium]
VRTGLTILVLVVILVTTFGFGYAGYQTAIQTDLERASNLRSDLSTSANSGFDAEVDISTPGQALTYLPQGLVQFAFGPFPWQVRGIRQLPVVVDVLAWWALIPSLWRGLRAGWRQAGRRVLVLLLPALATTLLLSLVIGNFGILVRSRSQVLVLLLPIMALGVAERRGRRQVHIEPAPAPAAF